MSAYDPAAVARYFDDFADREWERLVRTPGEEVKLHVHAEALRRHVAPGAQVLEIGAGAGRFTQVLAALGASVVVADLSPVQLELNRRHATEEGFAGAVRDWLRLDVCDLSPLGPARFDAVVCYGGPLSYVFDQRARAVREIRRVLAPGGRALVSVMALWGTVHEALPGVLAVPAEENARIIATGDLRLGPADGTRHHCHLFRSAELAELLGANGLEVLEMSASSCLSTVWGERLAPIRADPARWAELLAAEVMACREPGCLDMGTHLIAVARREAE